jgi:hypothetical protein
MIKPASIALLLDSRIYRSLPAKARLFFLSKISDRYLLDLRLPVHGSREEVVVGYESGWPRAYKKVRPDN